MKKNTLINLIVFAFFYLAPAVSLLEATTDSDLDANTKLIVGTKESPPFSIKRGDGTWEGLSIKL